MMLRTHLLQCNPALARDAFHGTLLRDAAPIAACIPGMRHYAVNAVVDASHRLKISQGPFALDAVTHMWFDDAAARANAQSSVPYRELDRLLRPLLQTSIALDVVQRHFVWPVLAGAGGEASRSERASLLKRMSVLQRPASLTATAFQDAWRREHGPRVAAHAGALRGYIQDAVSGWSVEQGGQGLPGCDGLTELWFADHEAMQSVLPQSAPSSVTDNAARIISSISTFLVREIEYF